METIQLNMQTTPFPHNWEYCVGAGRANEGLRADWQKQLKFVSETCGFKTIRFHGLFHDDMFVINIENDKIIYNWQYVDSLFDAILDCDMKPFVELGFCPTLLASDNKTQFWWKGNISPPKDYSKWKDLIENFVRHLQERYRNEEIETWNFEVWNEPNLGCFWSGTRSEYFELYKTSVDAIKGINKKLKIGGPTTSNFVPDDRFAGEREDITLQSTFTSSNIDEALWKPVWLEEFLTWCNNKKLPVDFISCHPYPTDFALDIDKQEKGLSRKVSATVDDLKTVNKIMEKSTYHDAKRYYTEWSSSPSSRDCSHDYMPAAVYVMKTLLEGVDYYDCLSYWTFTDIFEEVGAGNSAFHGGFGMVNFQGIPKPVWHTFKFMHKLGTHLVCNKDGLVTTLTDSNKLSAIAYNYPKDFETTVPIHYYPDFEGAKAIENIGKSNKVDIVFKNLAPNATIEMEYVDSNNGSAMNLYDKMKRPSSPSREEVKQLKEAANSTKISSAKADENGNYHLIITLQPWSFLAIREL